MINTNMVNAKISEDDFKKFCNDGCIICHSVNDDTDEALHNGRTVTKADIIKTQCQHLYHAECLIKQITINEKDEKCPYCRSSIVTTIRNLKPITINRSINKMAEINNPQGAMDIISKNPNININVQNLNLGLTKALSEQNVEKINLWIKLGANNSIVLHKKLEEFIANDDEEKALYLINLKTKPDHLETINLILQFLAKKNKPALFSSYSGYIRPGSYKNILQQGIDAAAKQNAFKDAEAWIINGAIPTVKTITEGLKQAVASEEPESAKQWLYIASLYKVKKLSTVDILEVGLQQATNNNKPYLAKKWIALGANKNINTLNKGFEIATTTGDYQNADTWLDLGADKNIMLLNQAYINANSEQKIFWQKLGATPLVNELNLELKQALASDNFINSMLLLKRGAVVSLDEMNATKERMSNNVAWQKLIDKYIKKMQYL